MHGTDTHNVHRFLPSFDKKIIFEIAIGQTNHVSWLYPHYALRFKAECIGDFPDIANSTQEICNFDGGTIQNNLRDRIAVISVAHEKGAKPSKEKSKKCLK